MLKDRLDVKLAYISVVLNLYYFISWIYIFESFEYEYRMEKFAALFPALLVSGIATHIFMILFSLYSILIFSKYRMPHFLMIVIQVVAIFLYLFQYL